MRSDLFELFVRVHGHPIRTYSHNNQQGQQEIWAEGRRGSEFTLRVQSHTSRRALAAVSVDGLSVMDGEPAGYNSGGYIIEPFGHIDIPGWRLDNREVARFKFSDPGRSYSKKSGKGLANVGIIGAAIFLEKQRTTVTFTPGPPVVHHHHYRDRTHWQACWPQEHDVYWIGGTSGTTTSAEGEPPFEVSNCCASPGEPAPNSSSVLRGRGVSEGHAAMDCNFISSEPGLGTEFGKAQGRQVESVDIDVEDKPCRTLLIRYGTRGELLARGVNMEGLRQVHSPSAFPQAAGCKPPKCWWR